jgi:branched-chain amino acid transport system substrate-binding protein
VRERRDVVWRAMCAALILAVCAACAGPGGATPGDAAPVVKIGLIAPFEGLGRPLGYEVLPAVKLAVAEANAGGQLGRYQVMLTALNDDLDAAAAASAAAALSQDADLLAVVGPWSQPTAAAALPVLSRAGIPALAAAPLAAAAQHPRLPGAFSLCPTPAQLSQALTAEAIRAHAPNILVAGPHNALYAALVQADPQMLRDTGAALPPGTAMIFTGEAADADGPVVRWREAGWRGLLFGGPDLARPWLAARAGAVTDGAQAVVCADAQLSPQAPNTSAFAAAYQKQTGAEPGPQARLAYAAARQLLDALARDIQAHGRPTRAALTADLARSSPAPQLAWVVVKNGQWVAR